MCFLGFLVQEKLANLIRADWHVFLVEVQGSYTLFAKALIQFGEIQFICGARSHCNRDKGTWDGCTLAEGGVL